MSSINTPTQVSSISNGRRAEFSADPSTLNPNSNVRELKIAGSATAPVNGVTRSEDVQAAMTQVREQFQNVRRELEFSVDEKLHKVIITVHDGATGDVIRQIPSEEFIRMARAMHDADNPHILDARA
ncbi:MAG: hypothetical protein GC138_01915 [Gammaproteobacteria bacterium]|nr:hypothetical protein [Gammaproteobacteria bacterium]